MQIWFEYLPNLFRFILFYLQKAFTSSLSIFSLPILTSISLYLAKNFYFIPFATSTLKSSWPNMFIYAKSESK